ncbi:conjugal transfer protein TraH [Nitrospirillum amazonense]|uniref:conjugal transfer protein TraH n=1 Tax=Nitrospirillum amazonense TaxID=28077 RepID=UPI002412C574|nr:conjugal transfer protein TraH [Nitrospirillum amazonense]MDG3444547.1 conjugal transfer protein TraH [Nitrospirillum amazonense]
MTIKRRFLAAALALAMTFQAGLARADIGGQMQSWWNGMGGTSNVTRPSTGQAAGYYSGGSLYARSPIKHTSLLNVQMPSIRAGCGGIDIFTGAFSHISAGELIAAFKGIANNAAGFAFKLGIETLAPVVDHEISYLNDLVGKVNQFGINSCQTAASLVGGLWPATTEADRAICSSIANKQGLFSDWAADQHGCGTQGARKAVENAADPAMKAQLPTDNNMTWNAIKSHSFLSTDSDLMNMMQTLVGTLIVNTPDSDGANPSLIYIKPRVVDAQMVQVLLRGGSLPLVKCDENTNCLHPTTPESGGGYSAVIDPSKAFIGQVSAVLSDMTTKAKSRQPLSAADLDFLDITSLPVNKMLTTNISFNANQAQAVMNTYAEAIALDEVFQFLQDCISMVSESGMNAQVANKESMEDWLNRLKQSSDAIYKEQQANASRVNNTMEMVRAAQFMDGQVAARVGSRLAQSMQYAGGRR